MLNGELSTETQILSCCVLSNFCNWSGIICTCTKHVFSFLASSSIIFPVIVGVGNVGEESTSSRLRERAPRREKVLLLELWGSQRQGKQSNTPSKCRKLSRISQHQNPPALSINLKYVSDRWGRSPNKKKLVIHSLNLVWSYWWSFHNICWCWGFKMSTNEHMHLNIEIQRMNNMDVCIIHTWNFM